MSVTYQKIINLVNYLNECTKAYDEGKPLITDKEWDDLYFQLEQLEKEAGLILSNSPTQSISFEVVNELQKVEHDHKMLSLEKTKSADEVLAFCKGKQILAMCKMDGLTCSLTYENGELVSAETRGNGLVGENILHNAKIIPSIPKTIPYKEKLTIDGEIICTYKDFKKFEDVYKNPRNFASGSIRLLSAKECATRSLTFVAWDVMTPLQEYNLLSDKLIYLKSIGFTTVPFIRTVFKNSQEVEDFISDIKWAAEENSYPIDGAVFKFNDCEYGLSLGETSHHFKNAIAFKFYDEIYQTHLLDIEWTMGRTGVLTPVAIFEPIDIDGSTVERASLHNITVMEELFHGTPFKNQLIEVYKANMIIPQVYSADNARGMPFYCELPFIDIPKECPVCGGLTEEVGDLDTRVLKCTNSSCEGKVINKLDHFCGKKGLDMKGISKATLEKLVDWGWIDSIIDIFELEQYKAEWIQKPGFGVKSVEKILNSIDSSRKCDLNQFICALGIPLIGNTASKALQEAFQKWNEFIYAVDEYFDFSVLPNFGMEMHNNIINFDYREARFIADNYIQFNDYEEVESGSDLAGKTFVITGKLTQFKNRDEIKAKIESLGGKVTGSVSKNTDYLINNDVESTSSKNKTAKSLGIPILSENDFIETFGIV
jgi:DNA ligase (NAD+)